MAGSKLPPQAYTRDILAHAYEWLKNQPGSVRDLATSADNLVALYLQSKRRIKDGVQGYNLNEHIEKKSKVDFKNELKNLSEGLKQFDDNSDVSSASRPHPPTAQPIFTSETSHTGAPVKSDPRPAKSKTYNLKQTPVQAPAIIEPDDFTEFRGNQKSSHRPVNILNPDTPLPTINTQPQIQVVVQQPAAQNHSQPYNPAHDNGSSNKQQQQAPNNPYSHQMEQGHVPPSVQQQHQQQPPPMQQQQYQPHATNPQSRQQQPQVTTSNQAPLGQPPAGSQGGGSYTQEQNYPPAPSFTMNANGSLDARTQAYLTDVKNRLNLSNENEALRILIAIGYDKLSQILPR